MACLWYLGLEATEECIKTCTITEKNRDICVRPETLDADDDFELI